MKLANINIQAPDKRYQVLLQLAAPLMVLGIFFYYKSSIKKAVNQVATPIADLYVDMTHEPVIANFDGFFLESSDLEMGYRVKQMFIDLNIQSNINNKAIFKQLLDPRRNIKPRYRHLIDSGKIINLEALQ
ncbi:hypothetical protein HR060_10775 [Catenovulum sp. SM1970]|uniref:hypothetical protein n=1 Tax=Marinifaba aquimaris TaxID=2741323 RepID=UPI001572C861|nr:hypothetical protein [Marinifaba aquimaris]NTS77348.1 hypothetical protein [Marinifaba aquimaris]